MNKTANGFTIKNTIDMWQVYYIENDGTIRPFATVSQYDHIYQYIDSLNYNGYETIIIKKIKGVNKNV